MTKGYGKSEPRSTPNEQRGDETMRKTKKNTLAAGALVALLLTGCETRMTNPHAASTAALTQRKAYLLERERASTTTESCTARHDG